MLKKMALPVWACIFAAALLFPAKAAAQWSVGVTVGNVAPSRPWCKSGFVSEKCCGIHRACS